MVSIWQDKEENGKFVSINTKFWLARTKMSVYLIQESEIIFFHFHTLGRYLDALVSDIVFAFDKSNSGDIKPKNQMN